MKNRKKGFTLIELIVCIAIISALSVTVGVGLTKVMRQTRNSRNEALFEEIFNATSVYTQMKDFACDDRDTENNCVVSLDTLISKGLLDKELLEKDNPLYNNKNTFEQTKTIDKLIVSHDSDGEKYFEYRCGNNPSIKVTFSSNQDVENFKDWGKC